MDRSERVGSAYFYIEREVLKTTLHVMHSHSSYELWPKFMKIQENLHGAVSRFPAYAP